MKIKINDQEMTAHQVLPFVKKNPISKIELAFPKKENLTVKPTGNDYSMIAGTVIGTILSIGLFL